MKALAKPAKKQYGGNQMKTNPYRTCLKTDVQTEESFSAPSQNLCVKIVLEIVFKGSGLSYW
jgi:hypothetical protein